MADDYVAVSRIWFSDGSTVATEIRQGSHHECRQSAIHQAACVPVAREIDGKVVKFATVRVMPKTDWKNTPVRR